MSNIYKVLTEAEWKIANLLGFIETDLDKDDGFIHLSTSKQLVLTLIFEFKKLTKKNFLKLYL